MNYSSTWFNHYILGNLCRCTGYRPILDGYKTFVDDKIESDYSCPMGNDCCQNRNKIPTTNSLSCETITNGVDNSYIEQNGVKSNLLFNSKEFQPYDSSQELIFPPELAVSIHPLFLYIVISVQLISLHLFQLITVKKTIAASSLNMYTELLFGLKTTKLN